jgi:hypothetical protein
MERQNDQIIITKSANEIEYNGCNPRKMKPVVHLREMSFGMIVTSGAGLRFMNHFGWSDAAVR